MEKNKDVRILTLQKQHYFKTYKDEMKCDYTCWGYYDGITIKEAAGTHTALFEKRSDAPISQMWYGSGQSVERLDGLHSRQNIGIFRDFNWPGAKEKINRFWKLYYKSPYLAVGFLKIKHAKEYRGIAGLIEAKSAEEDKKYVKFLVYYTLDNADLILISLSNNLHKLKEKLQELEEVPDVQYLHSILGANESFLYDLSQQKELSVIWNGIPWYPEEKIDRLFLKVAVSGNLDTLEKLSAQIRNRTGITCVRSMYGFGHQSTVLIIRDLSALDLLSLYVPGKGGILTHANPLFGTEIYNIESEIFVSGTVLNTYIKKEECVMPDENDGQARPKRFGELLIRKYKEDMKLCFENQDESMYSYYKAIIQTTNTLTQYEGFPMAKDIFYLLFPAVDMFDRHLYDALSKVNIPADSSDEKSNMVEIKESVCEFINSVNSIIYHTIHTDQVFLMIPGYSGTSFSIPVKLCLMYLWLAGEVIGFLNDKNYEYNCFITPQMESKPVTTLINMGMSRHDRLICFCSSQRSLYMPRHFMTILTHEIAHYVGTDIRMRKVRAASIIKTLAYFLAEGVFQEEHLSAGDLSDDEKEMLKILYAKNKSSAQKRAVMFLRNKIAALNCDYHATEIRRPLEEGCLEFLSNGSDAIYSDIFRIPQEIMDMSIGCKPAEKAKMLYNIQMKLNDCRISLQTSGVMESIIKELIWVYREVFSDLTAIAILQCDKKTFMEAYDVSEGNHGPRNIQQKVRDYIADLIFWKKGTGEEENFRAGSKQQETAWEESESNRPGNRNNVEKLYKNMYFYVWVKPEIMEYAKSSYSALEERLKKVDEERLKSVRDFFGLFSRGRQETNGKGNTCDEIYDEIVDRIEKYKERTEEQYVAWIAKNQKGNK